MRIGRRDVRLTNVDKFFFPEQGLTKGDLIAYYVDVADCVLHHVRRRPMHVPRFTIRDLGLSARLRPA